MRRCTIVLFNYCVRLVPLLHVYYQINFIQRKKNKPSHDQFLKSTNKIHCHKAHVY